MVFLDTVGLIAVWDERDQWHGVASAVFGALLGIGTKVTTTTFVLLECGNAAARRPYRVAMDDLRAVLEADNSLVTPTDADWQAAWEGYRRGVAGDPGLVDNVSFAVMRRLGLARAFTSGRHFRAAGFEALF